MDADDGQTEASGSWRSGFGITSINGWASVAMLQKLHPHTHPGFIQPYPLMQQGEAAELRTFIDQHVVLRRVSSALKYGCLMSARQTNDCFDIREYLIPEHMYSGIGFH